MMVVYESTWFCWEVQGLEQGKFLQMRSFRVLAFPCLASLALVERRAWTCGDAFCGSWPHITNRRIASSVPRRGYYLSAELCVGWILSQENIEAWMYAHGVQSSEILSQGGRQRGLSILGIERRQWWVGGRWWKRQRVTTGLACKAWPGQQVAGWGNHVVLNSAQRERFWAKRHRPQGAPSRYWLHGKGRSPCGRYGGHRPTENHSGAQFDLSSGLVTR